MITIITPYDEGLVDTGGDISAGIRVYQGKLQLKTIKKLTEEPGYPKRAVAVLRDARGAIEQVLVTYSNDDEDIPHAAAAAIGDGWEGDVFEEEDHAKGHLSYEVEYSELRNPHKDAEEDDGDASGAATGSDDFSIDGG